MFETRYPKLISLHTTTKEIKDARTIFLVKIIVKFSKVIKIRDIKNITKNRKTYDPEKNKYPKFQVKLLFEPL